MTGFGYGVGRLLRIEVRRTPAWLLLPVLAVLTWLASPYGRSLRAPVALWSARSVAMQGSLQVIGPFAAGIAAWVAARESRRRMTDLIACTPRPALGRRLLTWAASTAVGLLFYAVATAVSFTVTAGQATWSGPLWWPVGVGALGVTVFSALGFALGVQLPSRFTAPLVAIGLLFGLQLTLAARFAGYATALVSPVVDSVNPGTVPFSGTGNGIVVVQLIFLAGVLLAALALASLPRGSARWAAAAVTVAGLALAGTAVGLARTAVQQPGRDLVIPALSSNTATAAFTPVCDTGGPLPVCVHPAFRRVLRTVAGDLAAITTQVAGLPAAPATVDIGMPAMPVPAGHVVLTVAVVNSQGPMTGADIRFVTRFAAAAALVGIRGDFGGALVSTPARTAVADGMMLVAGETLLGGSRGPDGQLIMAAARRYAALPATARRQWLAAHLAALLAGALTPEQLP